MHLGGFRIYKLINYRFFPFVLALIISLNFPLQTLAQSKNISLDCKFPRGVQFELFKDRHPSLFETTRLKKFYAKEGLSEANENDLEKIKADIFLQIADLEIRSVKIDLDFGERELIKLNGSVIQLPNETAEWTETHLRYAVYMPAFSIHYRINRSDLTFSALYNDFPPKSKDLVFWSGSCSIVPEPVNKF